jgi:hypothetical protein
VMLSESTSTAKSSTDSHPKTHSFYSKVHMHYSTPGKRWN